MSQISQNNQIYDVIIIGGGPAGLSAAIYTSRRALKTLIISKDIGGQVINTNDIENYPGFERISGPELARKWQKQAAKFGAEFKFEEVKSLEEKQDNFRLNTEQNHEYFGKTIILAFGLTPRDLGVPGEQKYKGRGVSYCATCDGPLFKNKIVAVVGGGNSALDATGFLAKISQKVYLIHRRDQFRGETVLKENVKNNPAVEILFNSKIKEIKGNKFVESIEVENNQGQKQNLKIDGIFVEIGHIAKTEFLKNIVKLNSKHEIIADKDSRTSHPGIFAAGDVTDNPYKQIVISAGEGAKAALQAYKYLHQGEVGIDWGKKN